ncbi:GNAT family N-acetyltransferase [Pararhodobacter oceanensis]|uniref:GNAT family N-acetyltransferase n=1 Tax=Pararhodobacter oceanensis TaxID=2172121 RepID=A0A2T8HRT3_9RHOB|nr:GNAT family N-acetyltransferase [Pararhodobacter oceanensis]PVH28141.1 GNAT family N-acetyltransferase [Pararhodobacter oceanensis]
MTPANTQISTVAERFEALIPRLETERLILRGHRPADFDAFAAYAQTPRSTGTGGPLDRNLAWRSFCNMTGHWVHRGYGFWVIEDRASARPLGACGLWFPEGWPEREIGWMLWTDAAEGKGIAHEAALAARSYAYDVLGWDTAISLVLDDNTRSAALARRMGCVADGSFEHAQYGAATIWRHPAPADLADGGMEAYA